MTYAFSANIWLYAAQTEVFALNNFLNALLIRMAVHTFERIYHDKPTSDKASLCCAFLSGLALCNQHTSIFFIIPMAAHLLWYRHHHHRHLSLPFLVKLAMAFMVSFVFYAYLPYASIQNSAYSWGDLSSMKALIRHMLRSEYGTFKLAVEGVHADDVSTAYRLQLYLEHILSETFLIGAFLAIVGMYCTVFQATHPKHKHKHKHKPSSSSSSLSRSRAIIPIDLKTIRPVCRALFVSWLFYIIVFSWLNQMNLTPLMQGVQERFYLQPNLTVFVFGNNEFDDYSHGFEHNFTDFVFFGLNIAGIGASYLCPHRGFVWTSLAFLPLLLNWSSLNFHDVHIVEDVGRAILTSMPKNAIIFVGGDVLSNPISYLQSCENMRADVSVSHMMLMQSEWYVPRMKRREPNNGIVLPGEVFNPFDKTKGFSSTQLMSANVERRPTFLCGKLPLFAGDRTIEMADKLFSTWRFGICSRVLPRAKPPTNLVRFYEKSWKSVPTVGRDAEFSPKSWEAAIITDVWKRRRSLFTEVMELFERAKQRKLPERKPLQKLAVQMATMLLNTSTTVAQTTYRDPPNVLRMAQSIVVKQKNA